MKPIRFSCQVTLSQKPEEIASQILDLSKWPEFNGYGPLPGIKLAEFETKTAETAETEEPGETGEPEEPGGVGEDSEHGSAPVRQIAVVQESVVAIDCD